MLSQQSFKLALVLSKNYNSKLSGRFVDTFKVIGLNFQHHAYSNTILYNKHLWYGNLSLQFQTFSLLVKNMYLNNLFKGNIGTSIVYFIETRNMFFNKILIRIIENIKKTLVRIIQNFPPVL